MIAINELLSPQTKIEQISLSNLVLDRETQIRVKMCDDTIQRYATLMETEEGRAKFPPGRQLFRLDHR